MSARDILGALECDRPGCVCHKSTANGKGNTHCPSHTDTEPSLNVGASADVVLVKCFGGCTQDAVIKALSDRGLWERHKGGSTPPNGRATVQPPGCTLDQYAKAKAVPADFLHACGLSDVTYQKHPAVRIPYLGPAGEDLATRFRLAISGPDRFRWKSGDRPALYGLGRLDDARGAGYVFLVEGESDAQTAWLHHVPAVGIPGASLWRDDRDAEHFEGIERIYLVVEPDKGGATLVRALSNSRLRDRVHLVRLPSIKDINDLHRLDPEHFSERLEAAREEAVPLAWEILRQAHQRREEMAGQAKTLAREPNILDVFTAELRRVGVVGEDRACKIIFLAFVSRILSRPISLVVKGPSSAGKSFVVEITLRFFPPEAAYVLSAMSEHALAYGTEPISHRHLVLYEAAGMAGDFASYLIRSLLSEGRLRYETVVKTPEGLEVKLIEREGPTGLVVTTTAIALHPENETRLISVPVTDTAEQTARVLLALAEDTVPTVDFARWHALHEWMATGPDQVVIPYARALAEMIPPVAVRLRRDFSAVLNLIRAHALLHQSTREQDPDGRVVAVIEDYAIVRDLIVELVSEGVGATVATTVRETALAVRDLAVANPTTVVAVAERLHLDKSAAWRRVRAATERGYVKNLEDKRGRPARLVVGDPLPEDVPILPEPERLHGCSANGGGTTPPAPEKEHPICWRCRAPIFEGEYCAECAAAGGDA